MDDHLAQTAGPRQAADELACRADKLWLSGCTGRAASAPGGRARAIYIRMRPRARVAGKLAPLRRQVNERGQANLARTIEQLRRAYQLWPTLSVALERP